MKSYCTIVHKLYISGLVFKRSLLCSGLWLVLRFFKESDYVLSEVILKSNIHRLSQACCVLRMSKPSIHSVRHISFPLPGLPPIKPLNIAVKVHQILLHVICFQVFSRVCSIFEQPKQGDLNKSPGGSICQNMCIPVSQSI